MLEKILALIAAFACVKFFSTPDIPEPEKETTYQTASETDVASNAAEMERRRRLRAQGKQKNIFAGFDSTSMIPSSGTLGGV